MGGGGCVLPSSVRVVDVSYLPQLGLWMCLTFLCGGGGCVLPSSVRVVDVSYLPQLGL